MQNDLFEKLPLKQSEWPTTIITAQNQRPWQQPCIWQKNLGGIYCHSAVVNIMSAPWPKKWVGGLRAVFQKGHFDNHAWNDFFCRFFLTSYHAVFYTVASPRPLFQDERVAMYTCHYACTLKLKAACGMFIRSACNICFSQARFRLCFVYIITFRPVISTANTKLGQRYVNKINNVIWLVCTKGSLLVVNAGE